MAVSQAIPITRHPFANGSYKQMLIDGKWVDAASGKRFETHNPATGELLATVAEAGLVDDYRFLIAPTALGHGKAMFGSLTRPLHLRLVATHRFESGSVLLEYVPQ